MIDSTGELLAVGLFAAICGGLVLGYPVAFTLAGVSLLFAVLGHAFGHFDLILFMSLAPRYFGVMLNETLVAVPLFIFMGLVLERSGIAESLLVTMGQLFGRLRGGLGFSVVIVGAILAASTGVVGATVVTMSLISLPTMLRAGYDRRLACGTICAAATLAQIIPPSTVLIFIADILQGANQLAQLETGNFAPRPVSVGDLFAGALLPGLLLVSLYLGWMAWVAWRHPERAPAVPMTAEERRALPVQFVTALLAPLLLILAVLGSILAGIATATSRPRSVRSAVVSSRPSGGRLEPARGPRGHAGHGHDHLDDLRHPAGRLHFLPRLPRLGRRGSGGGCAARHAGRCLRRHAGVHGGDVRPGLLPRYLRDHLHHAADLRAARS